MSSKASTALRGARAGGKRARTRAQLLDAALRVFARKGQGAASIQEVTAEAGLANGTFYNYFRTHEELVDAACLRLAARFSDDITASSAQVSDPAERVAIGTRRFVLQALRDPVWGAAILRVWSSTPVVHEHTARAVLADLRAGRRRGRFRIGSEAAAVDLVQGAVLAAMRTVLEGRAGERHATVVAALVLRGLGVEATEADDIARRPLPVSDVEHASSGDGKILDAHFSGTQARELHSRLDRGRTIT
jgi:AcrR family transcriptional regulator